MILAVCCCMPAVSLQAARVIEPIQTVSEPLGLDPGIVALGDRLFHDLRLSRNNTVSCAHCHRLNAGGDDDMPVSIGIEGKAGDVNAPTVFNLNLNIAFFWDGRASTLEELVDMPLKDDREMDTDWPEVLSKLGKDRKMVADFERLFPGKGMTKETIARSIADFMRSLVTLDSPMDRWLNGEKDALTQEQLRGYRLFKSYGCVACHQGEAVGGNMYAGMGAFQDYFRDRKRPLTIADNGRFNVTGDERDRHVFKVPGLRLVTLTAPYFHDAGAATLEEAIVIMGKYQLGRQIPKQDVSDIKAFLGSLLGTHPRLVSP